MARILLHTLGSSGDFNPAAALALTLRERGHRVTFAVSPSFARAARTLGFEAAEVGPDPDYEGDLMKRMLAPSRLGTSLVNILFREVLIPAIRPAADALTPLAAQSDLFLSHTIQLAAPVVARRTGTPWVSFSPSSLVYPTGEYPPPGVAWRGCPAALGRLGWRIGERIVRPLEALANAEYAALGQPPLHPVVSGGAYSRRLTLGLWSPAYFPRPADWPDWLQVGGYARWDMPRLGGVPPALPTFAQTDAFFDQTDAPLVVFTLGSAVVSDPRRFWEVVLAALLRENWRAILLGAPDTLPVPPAIRERVLPVRYAPYADLFPRAQAIVHAGGTGTTQAACWHGVPSVVVPRAADQFENAAHIQREGLGLRLQEHSLSANVLRLRLTRLLASRDIAARVAALGQTMRAEPGASRSADLVERVLPAAAR